jgi:hypothetical protein
VRSDKPQPYVQWVSNGRIAHASVTLGVRGEVNGLAMVGITGVAENAEVINGTLGPVREGTLVKRKDTK